MNVTHVTGLRDTQPASHWYQNSSHLCYGPDPELDKASGVSYYLLVALITKLMSIFII